MRREDAKQGVALPFVVAWAVFATYLVAARIVRNLFPLSVFDMYQAHAAEAAARVVALDSRGETLEIEELEGWACEQPPSLLKVEDTCGPRHRPLTYVARDQELWIEAHRGPTDASSEPIVIVSRAHALAPSPGQPSFADCVIATCTATRRGGSR
jgi:hypothetical protein